MALLGAGVGTEVWIHGRQLEAAEKRITKATQEQVKATVRSEVTKSMEQFEKGLLASVAKVVQEELTPMKVTLQDVQGRVVYLDSVSMTMTSMMLANCQKKK